MNRRVEKGMQFDQEELKRRLLKEWTEAQDHGVQGYVYALLTRVIIVELKLEALQAERGGGSLAAQGGDL